VFGSGEKFMIFAVLVKFGFLKKSVRSAVEAHFDDSIMNTVVTETHQYDVKFIDTHKGKLKPNPLFSTGKRSTVINYMCFFYADAYGDILNASKLSNSKRFSF
jgi:hypothetical protein